MWAIWQLTMCVCARARVFPCVCGMALVCRERGCEGAFLLRIDSASNYGLSAMMQGQVVHVEVKKGDRGGVTFGNGKIFPTITQMVRPSTHHPKPCICVYRRLCVR